MPYYCFESAKKQNNAEASTTRSMMKLGKSEFSLIEISARFNPTDGDQLV